MNIKDNNNYLAALFALIILLLPAMGALAIDNWDDADNQLLVKNQLITLNEKVNQLKAEINAINVELQQQKSIEEREALLEKLKSKKQLTNEYLEAFADIATGTADIDAFKLKQEHKINIEEEIYKVFSPVISKIKKITEQQRIIDELERKLETLDYKLSENQKGLDAVSKLLNLAEQDDTQKALINVQNKWLQRQSDLETEQKIISIKIKDAQAANEKGFAPMAEFINNFIVGHGVNLFLAIVITALCFTSLRFLAYLVRKQVKPSHGEDARVYARVFSVAYDAAVILLSLLTFLIVLFIRDDWFFLVIFIIILVGLVFSLKDSIPSYVREARYLLNIGSAREGERVVYNGIPWNISRVNLQSVLINPRLSGGMLRLPLRVMIDLVSRPWDKSEPWFPTKMGDYVLLADGTYGQAVEQTPDVVVLKLYGDAQKSYKTQQYLDLTPHNLSVGFSVFVTFGFDYHEQNIVLDKIPETIKANYLKDIQNKPYKDFLTDITVEFEEAGTSSLNVMIKCLFDGDAAEYYHALTRFAQQSCVRTCNENDWNIPFNQLRVSMAE